MQLENQFEDYKYPTTSDGVQKVDVSFGFDNYSDKQIVDYSLKLLKESEVMTISIEMKEGTELGYIPFFFRKALSQKEKIEVVYKGKNKLIYKILLPFEPKALN